MWGLAGPGEARLGFDWMQSYLRVLNEPSNARVMRVKSPVASYWRANALDSFTGSTWFSSQHAPMRLPARSSGSSYTVPAAHPEPPGKLITMRFESSSLSTDYYFTGGAPRALSLERPGRVYLTGSRAPGPTTGLDRELNYTLTAVVPEVKPGDLVGRGRDYPQDVASYRLLPFPSAAAMTGTDPEREWRDVMSERPVMQEWQGLYALNRGIVGAAAVSLVPDRAPHRGVPALQLRLLPDPA